MKSILRIASLRFLLVLIASIISINAIALLLQFPNSKPMCNFHQVTNGMTKKQIVELLGAPKNGESTDMNIFSYDTSIIDGDEASISFDAKGNVYSASCLLQESCSPHQYICYFVQK